MWVITNSVLLTLLTLIITNIMPMEHITLKWANTRLILLLFFKLIGKMGKWISNITTLGNSIV